MRSDGRADDLGSLNKSELTTDYETANNRDGLLHSVSVRMSKHNSQSRNVEGMQNQASDAQRFTGDGIEELMQVNYVAPALLTLLLLPSLLKAPAQRIINVSSL
ncbi:hypothetical protein FRX31_016065, partial [Thalictrum thalictroides]